MKEEQQNFLDVISPQKILRRLAGRGDSIEWVRRWEDETQQQQQQLTLWKRNATSFSTVAHIIIYTLATGALLGTLRLRQSPAST